MNTAAAQSIRLPDYLVILAFFAIIIVAGLSFASRIRKAKDYFAAGSAMPWWLAGTSFYKASFSASMFVIYNEIAYKYGIVAIILTWLSPLTFLVSSHFTARLWRRARVMTPLGFMERRYSPLFHQVSVWTGLPLRVFDNSLRILATAIVFAVALRGLGLSVVTIMIIVGVVMVLYSFLGGQLTVMVTDFVNLSILFVASVTLFVMTLGRVGNLGEFVHRLPAGFLKPVVKPYDLSYMIFTVVVIMLMTYSASWSLVQKYNTLKSEAEIKKMMRWIAVQAFVMPPIFFFPGIAARVLLPAVGNAKEVYALMSFKILPVGLMGFVLAALVSSTMSSLGSEFNTLSGVLTRDFFMKKVKPGLDERGQVFWGRVFTVVIGALTVAMAVVFNRLQGFNLMDLMYRCFSAFAPAIMLPLIAGLFVRKVNARGALAGMIAGATTGVVLVVANMFLVQTYAEAMKTSPSLDFWLRSGWNSAVVVLSVAATIIGMWLGSRRRGGASGAAAAGGKGLSEEEKARLEEKQRRIEDERRRTDEFFADLARPFVQEDAGQAKSSALAPFRIIGLMLLAFGIAMAAIAVFILLFYKNAGAFRTDLLVAVILIALGLVMQLGKRPRAA